MRRDGSNILITLDEWLAAGLSIFDYKNDKHAGYLKTANRACYGNGVEIIWSSIAKESRRQAIIKRHGKPEERCSVSELESLISPDAAAMSTFSEYLLPDGRSLRPEVQLEYYNNAIVLNALNILRNSRRSARRSLSGSVKNIWHEMARAVNSLDRIRYPHSLPGSERHLRERFAGYKKDGYTFLIHDSFGNSNARKVDKRLERLILSIYCMSNNPYGSWVHEYYMAFIAGMLDVVDMKTGELYDRSDFFNDRKGVYISISESTCWNYIRNPRNRAIVEAIRDDHHHYTGNIRPHYHRHSARWSLSKISLDDRDLPRRMHDGNRVKAYYAYDVASGALIGAAYSVKKDTALFIDCVRDMFRFIDRYGYGMPMEVEVEHHIVGQFKDDLMKAGVVFPFVRWCAPGNSQEKHAEQLNRQKKYGYEKRYQDGIGRFYLKLEANRTGGERVYDEATNKYVIKEKTYTFEQLVADDRAIIEAYNSGLHRDQKMYRGMTRLEVLHSRLNPELAAINRAVLARYIGECVTTSIQRNMYCRVQYRKYMLPSPEALGRLAPNNYTVQAYYIPCDGEDIENVYIYQNGEYIAVCAMIETYNTSQAETTEADSAAMTVQAKYIGRFDRMVREGRENLSRVKLIEDIRRYETVEAEEAPLPAAADAKREAAEYASGYCEEYQAALAIESL
jgi:hypothetical protein